MTDKLRSREKRRSRESRVNIGSSFTSEESSDADFDMRDMRKKMSKKMRDDCNTKVSSRLKQAGARFPDEDSETTTSSGTDSSETGRKVRRRRREVKSGEKIKKRPVIRQMLWPHTIANEEDGESVTSVDIGLARFLSCFTNIMISCGRVEAAGRAKLLNSVSMVLECLPWADARIFHNMVMHRLEQGKIEWTSNFLAKANLFIDRKVRRNLRGSNNSEGGNKSNSKFYSKGARRARNSYNSNSYSKSKSSYPGVCWNWNFGTCSFAERCNRLHVCHSCTEAGKPGEQHKASSHESSRGNDRREPRR